jgi:hypothetical protein
MNVNNLLEGAAPYQVLADQSAKLAGKWSKSGLLEGIESSTERNNMAMLLENQAKQLVNESNTTGTGVNITAGGNSEAWAGVALPLVRRVFGEIVAKDLISVQPMNLPAGLIFYLDFQYGTTDATGLKTVMNQFMVLKELLKELTEHLTKVFMVQVNLDTQWKLLLQLMLQLLHLQLTMEIY